MSPDEQRSLEWLRAHRFDLDVLGEDHIVCLECGEYRVTLPAHLRRHDMNSIAYRERWGYDPKQPLVARYVSARLSQQRRAEPRKARRRRLDLARQRGFSPRLRGESSASYRKDVTVEAVVRLARQGMSVRETAERLKCTGATVRSRLRAAGVSFGTRRDDVTASRILALRATGLTVEKIATQLRVSRNVVMRRLREAGVERFDVRDKRPDVSAAAVAKARKDGLLLPQLVQRFECGVPLIIKRLRAAGCDIQLRPGDAGPRASLKYARVKRLNVASVLRLLLEGLSVNETAAALRCCTSAVQAKLSGAGLIPMREQPRHGLRPDVTVEQVLACRQKGLSIAATARCLKCSPEVVQRRLRTANPSSQASN